MLATSIGVGIVLVVIVASVAGWLFSSDRGVRSLFAQAPEAPTAVDVTRFTEGTTLSLDPTAVPVLVTSDLTIVRFSTSQSTTTAEDILVAIKPGTSQNVPAWITAIPHSAQQCTALGGAISCGGLALVDAATGKQVDDGATPTPQPEPNTTITASSTPVAGGDSGLATPVRITASATADLPFALGEDGLLRDSDGEVIDPTAFDTSTGAWAVSVAVRDTFAGRSVSSTHQVWTITDGHRLMSTNGSDVLWSTDLPDGTADLNGFVTQDPASDAASQDGPQSQQSGAQSGDSDTATPPRWLVSGSVGLLATPDGIHATNLVTGAEVWSIDTPVTQWLVQDGRILIWDGNSVILTSLSDAAAVDPSASPATLTPQSGENSPSNDSGQSGDSSGTQSGAQPTQDAQSGGASQSGDATPAPSPTPRDDGLPPDLADLSNAAVEVPSSCAPNLMPASGNSQTHTVSFRDGTAQTSEPLAGAVTLKSQAYSIFDGTPVSVVVLGCNAGGTTTHDQLAVYDVNAHLLGSVDPVHDDAIATVGSTTTDLTISQIAPLGKTIHVTISPVSLAGQNDCPECSAASAEETALVWNGSTFTQTDARYRTPDTTVRAPKVSDVQAFVDAASSGNDEAALPYATAQVLTELSQPASSSTGSSDPSATPEASTPTSDPTAPTSDPSASPSASSSATPTDSGTTLRSLIFPEGATVDRCQIIPALPDSGYVAMGDSGVFLPSSEGLSAGDFVCGVTSDRGDRSWMSKSLHHYAVYVLVHGSADGSTHVFGVGRSAE